MFLDRPHLFKSQDEVLLEFHVDDTAADDKEDTLIEMAFHVPPGNTAWGSDAPEAEGEEAAAAVPAAKVRRVQAWLELTVQGRARYLVW
jgi:hypothetical protein